MLHMGKAALGRGLPLDHYAFPTVGVPGYAAIGPGIDNALLFAIIRQESMFDPADWSHAHAMGLMQVTPAAGGTPASATAAPSTSSACAPTRPTICRSALLSLPACCRTIAATTS